jgi:hypothetical protein
MTSLLLGAYLLLTTSQSINFFSLTQDVEIGLEAEQGARPSLPPLVAHAGVKRYVTTIGQRITQSGNLPALPYRFEIVNSNDINSLGFPGGAIYIYRGLLEIASNDDELAAIVAHEVSHAASRHGTAQLSRQLLVQAPIAIAAGLPVADVWKEQITKLGISLGLDAPFLRYSRDQELEAGLMAARLLADARYDPYALRTLLEKIEEAHSSHMSRAPAFVFNHPQAQIVSPELAEEIERLAVPGRQARANPGFRNFRATLQKIAYQPTKTTTSVTADAPTEALPNIYTHPLDYYRFAYPFGWQITRTGSPNGAIVAPPEGVQHSRGGDDVKYGVLFDLFNISAPDRSLTLEQATNRLLVFLRQHNQNPNEASSWLRIVPGAQTQILISDEPGLRTVLIGKTDATGQPEVAWVVTRLYYQSLFYMVFVAPEDEFTTYQPVFEQMIGSIRLR